MIHNFSLPKRGRPRKSNRVSPSYNIKDCLDLIEQQNAQIDFVPRQAIKYISYKENNDECTLKDVTSYQIDINNNEIQYALKNIYETRFQNNMNWESPELFKVKNINQEKSPFTFDVSFESPTFSGDNSKDAFYSDLSLSGSIEKGRRSESTMGTPWLNRKRRRNGPMLYNRMHYKKDPYNLDHPSKYSSYNYIRGINDKPELDVQSDCRVLGMYAMGTKKINEISDKIIAKFTAELARMDCNSVTVYQLKSLMKAFGLNYTGKKNELLRKIKNLSHHIQNRLTISPKQVQTTFLSDNCSIVKSADKKSVINELNDEKTFNNHETNEINFMSMEYFFF
ncbi:hypothetical protein NUSPORA_01540 [Nucleospora cyclopteri]